MAGNIDNLNFKVILDDADFNRRVAEDIKAAKELNAQMSALLEAKKKLGNTNSATNTQRQLRDQQKLQQEINKTLLTEEKLAAAKEKTLAAQNQNLSSQQRLQQETNKTKISEERLARAKAQTLAAQNRANGAQRTQNRLLRECATLAASYFSIHTVTSFLSSLVRVSGEFELQRTTLRAILQDMDGADRIFNQLQALAVKSPFSFMDLTSYAKQLSAFSVPMEELYDTTKMLADVSAGLGVDMSRIILAYGQIRSAAFLRGTEVRQLTEAGIPILAELAKQFSEIEGRMVSAGEVFDKISLREVPFEMVEKVFKDMTSEGGKFFNMQEVQAETLKAKIKNLGDQYDIMLYQIGQAQNGILKGGVGLLSNMMEHWQAIGRAILDVVAGVGSYGIIMAGAWAGKKIKNITTTISLITRLAGHYKSLTKGVAVYEAMMVKAGKTTKAAFTASVVGIVAAIAATVIQLARSAGELNRELEKIANTKLSESGSIIDGLNTTVAKLEQATKGSQNYRDAIHELNSKYGEYLPNLITEKNTLEEIKLAADSAAEAIRNKAQASAYAEGSEKIKEKYGRKLNASQGGIISSLQMLFPSVGKQDAANIFTLWKDLIGAGEEPNEAIKKAVDSYLGKEQNWGALNYRYQDDLFSYIDEYIDAQEKFDEKMQEYNNKLGIIFSDDTPQSRYEQEVMSAIDAYYTDLGNAIKAMQLSEEEVNKMLKDLQIQRLENEILFYSGQGIALGGVYSYDKGVVRNDIVQKKQAELAKLTAKPHKGARLVQEALASVGVKSSGSAWGLWADESTSFTADGYYKVLDEQYSAIEPDLARAKERFLAIAGLPFEKADISKLNEEATSAYNEILGFQKKREAILAIAKALNYDLGSVSTEKRRSGSTKNPEQTAIELRIDTIKEMQSTFTSLLKEGLSTEQIDALMDIYFANVSATMRRNHDYWGMLSKEADNLAKYDKTAAAKLRTDISGGQMSEKGDAEKDRLKALAESKKYLDKTEEFLTKLEYSTKDVFGSGLALSIREALQEIEESNGEAAVKANEMLETLGKSKDAYIAIYGEEAWDKYKKNAEDAVDAWLKAEKSATKDVQQDRIKKLGDSFVKSFFKEKNKDISRLDQKSLSQLEDLLKLIRDELSDEDIKALIPQDLIDRAAKLGITLDNIVDAIKAARDEQEKVISDSFWKTLSDNLDDVKSALDDLGDAFSKFGGWGETLGAAFSAAGDALSTLGKAQKYWKMTESKTTKSGETKTVLTGEGKIGIIGTAISGVSSLLSLIGSQIQANKEAQEEWKQTVYETSLAYRRLFLDEMDYEQSNVWGVEDPFEKARVKIDRAMAAAKELQATMTELGNGQVQTGTKQVVSGSNTLKGVGYGLGTGASIGGAIGGWIGAAIGAAIGAVVGGTSAAAFATETIPVYNKLKDVYGSLFDEREGAEMFALNPKILADYDKLDEKTQALVDHWGEVQEAMTEAKDAIDETITDLIGQIDDDLSNALVEAFRNDDIYSALDEFHDAMTSVLEDILSQIAFTAAFGSLFDELQKALEDSMYNEDSEYYGMSWADILSMFENRLDEGIESYNENMKEMQEWGKKKGYDLYSNKDTNTDLSSGIKSITEDTASLLASYVNAIRSDLSMMRMMQIEGWNDVKEIRALMPAPTVWEQIAKIEAHAYDMAKSNALIAQHNAAMLAEMRSIITTEDGAPSVRTSVQ